MRAVVARTLAGPESLLVEERGDLVAGPGEVVVVDVASRRSTGATSPRPPASLPGIEAPLVPGSDLCRRRARSSATASSGVAPGDEVVGLPSLDWGDNPAAPGPEFRVLGGPEDGTFAEQIGCRPRNVLPQPVSLSWHEAAALPLAGVTVWRALHTRAQREARASRCSCWAPVPAPPRSPSRLPVRPARGVGHLVEPGQDRARM